MIINMIMVTTDSPEIRMKYVFASGSFFLVDRSSPVFLELYIVVRSTPIYTESSKLYYTTLHGIADHIQLQYTRKLIIIIL